MQMSRSEQPMREQRRHLPARSRPQFWGFPFSRPLGKGRGASQRRRVIGEGVADRLQPVHSKGLRGCHPAAAGERCSLHLPFRSPSKTCFPYTGSSLPQSNRT